MAMTLAELDEQISNCRCCELGKSRLKAVPGEGNERPDLLFVGEAPGWHENQQGRPFVGPAGAFLEQLLVSIGLRRGDVYIANVIKCRPPDNRDPLPNEIEACKPYLTQQIALLRPKMIVTLGRYSLSHFFPQESISRLHGSPRQRDGTVIFPMYHPAAALHQPSLRRTVEEDMRKIPAVLAASSDVPTAPPPSQQLSMF